MISLKTAPVQSQRRKILLRGEARIRKALYEEYRVGSKHARRRNRGGGEICFGIMRLQTLRNSVSPNFIHSSSLPHWIHGDTDAQGESPSIDGDNRDTRCRRGVPSTRPSECRARMEEEYGIRGRGGILREEGDKPLGTRGVQTVSSSSSSSREILRTFASSTLPRCSFLAEPIAMILPNLREADRLISRKGDRIRLPCDFTRGDNKVVGLVWKWMKFVHLIFIYTLDRAKGGSWNWLFCF